MTYKIIPEFENYSINKEGIVFSLYTNKERKSYYSGPYLVTKLRKNGISYTTSIHRILARTFLDLDSFASEKEVDHIDGNPANNRLDNLQVLTYDEHKLKTFLTSSPKNYCSVCNEQLSKNNSSGLCATHKYKNISIQDIEYWVKTASWARASRELGMSDVGLRKRYEKETGLNPSLLKTR